jgi:hypothetical protein
MTKELFVDGVLNVGFGRGIVRIDVGSLSLTQTDDKGKPLLELRQRLLLHPQGFLELHHAMGEMLKKLINVGVLQAARQAPGTDKQESEKQVSQDPKSPNFMQ